MKIVAIVINQNGEKLAKRLQTDFKGLRVINSQSDSKLLCEIVEKAFQKYEGILFFAAIGIVVRLISPFVKSKYTDPAIVCVDTAGRFAISLLSGHEGGANRLAYKVAAALDAKPVITTGTESHKKYIIGVGLRKGISKEKVKEAINNVLEANHLDKKCIRLIASVDLKKKEKGLLQACDDLDIPLVFINREDIKHFKADFLGSQAARRHIGVIGVCEPCALIAGRRTKLVLPKQIIDGVTIAVAKES